MKKISKSQGFTLIEILVVIGIIAILAAIVLIAINPARQFKQANDAQRTSNVNAILNAIGQRIADNRGKYDGLGIDGKTCSSLPSTTTEITVGVSADDFVCLTPTYIPTIPFDPKTGDASSTEYYVVEGSEGRVTISGVGEITNLISVIR